MINNTTHNLEVSREALTVREASWALNISECKVRRLLNSGDLAGTKLGGRWLIPAVEVERITERPIWRVMRCTERSEGGDA